MVRNIFFLVVFLCFSFGLNAQTTATVTDTRDGQIYQTIEIGNKTWMAQNLNFYSRGSWCFRGEDAKCKQYGRLYSWNSLMNGQSREKSQGLCRSGWHVPSNDEWDLLLQVYKKSKDLFIGGTSGFNILMAGCRFSNGKFDFENKAATFWSSSVDSSNTQYAYSYYGYADQKTKPLSVFSTEKMYGQYIRCVKNDK